MAKRVVEISLALALLAMLSAHASAQSSCVTEIAGLLPCLSYITGNSSTPSSSCCTQLSSVVQSQPLCLCLVLNGTVGSMLGIVINTTQALALPGACNVKTPPVSMCNASAGGPAASPAEPPKAIPFTPSAVPPEGGAKTAPSTNSQSSDGSSNISTRSLLVSLLLMAASVSALTRF